MARRSEDLSDTVSNIGCTVIFLALAVAAFLPSVISWGVVEACRHEERAGHETRSHIERCHDVGQQPPDQ